jgi:hypothetical protein
MSDVTDLLRTDDPEAQEMFESGQIFENEEEAERIKE